MEVQQGCRQGWSWWSWVRLAVTAAGGLLAVAVMWQAAEVVQEEANEPRADLVNLKQIAVNQFEVDDRVSGQALLTEIYDVEDLCARLVSERQETAVAAREHLVAIVKSSAPGPWEIQNEAVAQAEAEALGFDREARLSNDPDSSDPDKRSLGWTDEGLAVRQTAAGHERIGRQLEALRRHGFAELVVEVRILSGPVAATDRIATNWRLIGATAEGEGRTETDVLVESARHQQQAEREVGSVGGAEHSRYGRNGRGEANTGTGGVFE